MPVDDCSSQSCQNNPSCLDRCIEKDLSGNIYNVNLFTDDCSSQSCLNDPSCLDKCLKNGGALSFNEDKYNAVLNVTGSNLSMVESMDTELKILNEIKGIKQANELETKNIKKDIDELKNILSEIGKYVVGKNILVFHLSYIIDMPMQYTMHI